MRNRFCLFVFAIVLVRASYGQVAGPPINPQTKITISFDKTRFRDVIQKIFEGRATAMVDPDVDGILTQSFKDVPFEDVIMVVCKSADATYRIDGGVYSFVPRETIRDFGPETVPNPDRTLAIQFTSVPAQLAFHMLIGDDLVVDPSVTGIMSGNYRFASTTQAICFIADHLDAEVVLDHGKYWVRQKRPYTPWYGVQVHLQEHDGDVRDALRDLFRNVNVNYAIAPAVQGRVSCDLRGDFPIVLMRLLESVHCYYRVESNVIQVVHEPSPPAEAERVSFDPSKPVDIPNRFHDVITPAGLSFKDANIDDILQTLFTRVPNLYLLKHHYEQKKTIDISKTPLDVALADIVRGTPLMVRFVDRVFVFDLPPQKVMRPILLRDKTFIFNEGKHLPPEQGWVVGDPESHP